MQYAGKHKPHRKIIKQAVTQGAELVLLPEFFNSSMGFDRRMFSVAKQGKAVHEWLLKTALKEHIILGGSYLSVEKGEAYNKFELVFPNGDTYCHRKDIPTQFENCYYTDGDTNNILKTPIGDIGVALCWEMIRYDTVTRIYGKVDIVLACSCWWDLPIDAPAERNELRRYNRKLAYETPITFAKLLGVPVIHAAHCGLVTAYHFPDESFRQTRQYVGAAQIIGPTCDIISERTFEQGEGFVISDLQWSDSKPKKPIRIPERYWIPDLPNSYIDAWKTANVQGKEYYETAKKYACL